MSSIISLKSVSKHYARGARPVNVLHEISLQVEAGEFVALMGPSGSGKSTLLNLIGGLDKADHGDVSVAGQSLGQLSEGALDAWRARHVGFVFQSYNLLPVLDAEQNVAIPLLLTQLDGRRRRQNAQAALGLVGLGERTRHKPAELSGGQQQRVAIARAIVADPMLLLCDEPTGDLDRESADEVLQLLQSLNQSQGKTIILVTHDPRAAERATRRLYLDKGVLSGAQGWRQGAA
jgi:putative ABC transport system ATP-binding protein